MDDLLTDAERALAGGRPADALAAALDAWRLAPHPEVADAVRALGTAALGGFDAPKRRSRDEFQAAWTAIAEADPSPVATGWLAANTDHLVPVVEDRFGMLRRNWMTEKHAALLFRLELLRRRCPDPRVADAGIRLLRDGRYGFWDRASIEELYRPILDLVVHAGDRGAAGALRAIAASPRSKRATVREWLQQELPPVADRIEAGAIPPLPDAVAARWRALSGTGDRPRQPSTDVPALMREVLARPADDAVRHVLADALLEADDPRGQLLSLQLGGAPDGDPRVRKLVRAHQRAWIGPDLDDTLTQVVFRRGFLDEASLRSNAAASLEVWEAAARDERLATLRVLHQGNGNRQHYLRFLLSPQARDLRWIELPSKSFVDALAGGPVRPLERLRFGFVPKRPVLARIASAPAFATASGLDLTGGVPVDALVDDLVATGLAARVSRLSFDVLHAQPGDGPVLPRLAALARRLPALDEVAFAYATVTASARRDEDGDGWTLTVRSADRGADGLVIPDQGRVGSVWGAGLRTDLPPAPPDVVRVRLVGIPPGPARILAEAWGCPVERVAGP